MIVVRPIRASDYEALYQCAVESGFGFTSLPVDEELLRRRIDKAERSFALEHLTAPGEEGYLFVMENLNTQEVLGVSAIEAGVGLSDAFWHYRLGKEAHHSAQHSVHRVLDTLTLCNDYTGYSELCTLFLREPFRENRNGRVLSKFRMLFLAQFRERFAKNIIAEMRGVSDADGNSPFWGWLQKHFFGMEFCKVDYLTGIGDKTFISELMPRHPIYLSLLDEAAQKVVGVVHENTVPALNLLKSEGFSFRGYVDIFDAGPTIEGRVKYLKTVRASRLRTVKIGRVSPSETVLACNLELQNFRALQAEVDLNDEQVMITPEVADALLVSNGDKIRVAPF
ncbi:arginine N-succinyltransferase [Aliidiomarina quisquiliarum]|uniref:arginine N-succinyltransferase n=1 Tax=Aliidiomarina quisquiliarum TaxID=2938947 RepID=UPI00208F69F0|nr:arginine N-succinyltransferase [Aliidiomarina quisquiliarum]MCO4321143.1 arginine N-succinyltransferase [Aliidiomarina quisquiliarum]